MCAYGFRRAQVSRSRRFCVTTYSHFAFRMHHVYNAKQGASAITFACSNDSALNVSAIVLVALVTLKTCGALQKGRSSCCCQAWNYCTCPQIIAGILWVACREKWLFEEMSAAGISTRRAWPPSLRSRAAPHAT